MLYQPFYFDPCPLLRVDKKLERDLLITGGVMQLMSIGLFEAVIPHTGDPVSISINFRFAAHYDEIVRQKPKVNGEEIHDWFRISTKCLVDHEQCDRLARSLNGLWNEPVRFFSWIKKQQQGEA